MTSETMKGIAFVLMGAVFVYGLRFWWNSKMEKDQDCDCPECRARKGGS